MRDISHPQSPLASREAALDNGGGLEGDNLRRKNWPLKSSKSTL
ncbi:hypothetical protein BGP_6394 [Beggiatoa sp. PS]|nr:hypothetical protein BGP_6394 [Beggiatoa sp. PS]